MKFIEADETISVNLSKVLYFEDAGDAFTRIHFGDGFSLLSRIDYQSFKTIAGAAEDSLVPAAPDNSLMQYGLEAIQAQLQTMHKKQQFFAG